MITPQKIVKKATRKYREVLRAQLDDRDPFPMQFPVGKLPEDMAQRRRQIEALRDRSKDSIGQGYTIEWQTTQKQRLGKQTEPRYAIIASLDDYLAVVRKQQEFTQFRKTLNAFNTAFPN